MVTAANMYSAPDDRRDVVSQAILGQNVFVLEEQAEFTRIETPEPYRGWVRTSELVRRAGDDDAYAAGDRAIEISNLLAYVYRQPDVTQSKPLIQAPMGARLELTEEQPKENWFRVRLPSGEEGYLQTGAARKPTTLKDTVADPEQVIATARRLTGVPYLWGGTTPLGLDCSGFVGLAYCMHGVRLPRDSRQQFADDSLAPVERDDLQPGDLLYFGRQRVTHVGLYIGDEQFIHATTHGTPAVQESQLDEPHWRDLYLGARRPKQ